MVKSQKTDQVGGETDKSDQELCQPPSTTTNNQRKLIMVVQAITFTIREQPQPTTATYLGAVHLLRNFFFIDPTPKLGCLALGSPSDQQHCTIAHTK